MDGECMFTQMEMSMKDGGTWARKTVVEFIEQKRLEKSLSEIGSWDRDKGKE